MATGAGAEVEEGAGWAFPADFRAAGVIGLLGFSTEERFLGLSSHGVLVGGSALGAGSREARLEEREARRAGASGWVGGAAASSSGSSFSTGATGMGEAEAAL
jgi:hypothetical protein